MEPKPTHIGGQAIIEGVMMRGKNMYTIAVRTPENKIYTENINLESKIRKSSISKFPIFRGMIAFVDSLIIGTKTLTKSAEIAGLDESSSDNENISKFEKFLDDKFGDKTMDILIIFSVLLSIIMMVVLFMLLPVFLSGLVKKVVPFESSIILSALEGVIKMIIFLGYMLLISKLPDIQRVFMYHGAEHKTINCFENGEDLTVENVKKYSRLHKRCGTSFLLIVMVVSIFVFMFLKTDVLWIRLISRIVLVPFVAGISYEFIRLAGKSNSKFIEILSKPGMMLQKLTTNEPDDSQIEVSIAAMKGVLESESKGN